MAKSKKIILIIVEGTTLRPTVYFKLYRKTSPTGTAVTVPGDSLKTLSSGTTSVTWNNQCDMLPH